MVDISYEGTTSDYEILLQWATDKCTPLVREITFENAEVRIGSICCLRLGLKTIKKNRNSTPNKSQTQRARAYDVTSFLSADCELSTNPCSRFLYSLDPRSRGTRIFISFFLKYCCKVQCYVYVFLSIYLFDCYFLLLFCLLLLVLG